MSLRTMYLVGTLTCMAQRTQRPATKEAAMAAKAAATSKARKGTTTDGAAPAAKAKAPAATKAAPDLATLGVGGKGHRPLRLAVYAETASMERHLAVRGGEGSALVALCNPATTLVATTATPVVWKAVATAARSCLACRAKRVAAIKAAGLPLWQYGADEKRPASQAAIVVLQAS